MILLSSIIYFSSCQKDNIIIDTENSIELEKDRILGKKLENPYSVKNMQKAVRLLMSVAPEANYPAIDNIQPTHYYVKFLPKNTEEINTLFHEHKFVLSTVPYGFENRLNIDYYHDPSIPKDQITWLYATVPVGTEIPQHINHEILEEIYRPDNDEDELEVIALKISGNLKNEIIDGKEIMSSDLSDKELLGIFSSRYNPSGHVFVDNVNIYNQKIGELPVRNAAIELQTLWFEDVVNTDNNGYYYVSRRYKDITSIRLWNINDKSVISKTWTEHLGHWMRDKIGEGKANTRTVISQNQEDRWYKATVNNAFVDYDNFARANNIPAPVKVRTYVLSGMSSAGAPMLNNNALTFYSAQFPSIASADNQTNTWNQFRNIGIGMGTALVDIISALTGNIDNYPDIVIGMKSGYTGINYKSTDKVRSNVIHELAHYSHRKQISTNYWANVQYQAMFDKSNGIGNYGDGTANFAKYACVAEAWSHFVEYDQMNKIYNVQPEDMSAFLTTNNITTAYKVGYIPRAKWIPSGIFRDLMDSDGNVIQLLDNISNVLVSGIDQVSGFTYNQLYSLLTNDVNTIEKLKQKIINLYPHKNSNNEITKLFSYYGY